MHVSIDWIRDFVDLPEEVNDQLAQRFTMATCEVEDVIRTGAHLKEIRIAEILETEPHPDADKLRLVTFSLGEGETRRVVCGAPNARPGIKVPFAPIGTTLPGGFTLEPKKIRGILSEGMLCSEVELEIGDDDSGIKEFPADAPVGQTVAEYLGIIPDILFDIDNKSITHRPDLWGHYGMAREFASVFHKPLKDLFSAEWKSSLKGKFNDEASPIVPKVESGCACKAYYGLTVKNVKIGPSPEWIQRRLRSCGLRPINNMVDISNYVMLELGIPNHIFDYDKIGGSKIHIRTAGEARPFMTLDEVERQLEPSDTVICDAEKPLVIGGIMGGLESGVTEATSTIFIETANFVDSMVRKTSTRIGLRTDSSLRYEKNLDSQLLERTSLRILDLVLQVCPDAKVAGKLEYDGEDLDSCDTPVVATSCSNIRNVLGLDTPDSEIIRILTSLEFGVIADGDALEVTVPSWRATKDVECEADIIEEIGRIIGFDNITPASPLLSISPVRLDPALAMRRKIQDFLVNRARAHEVMTYPMVGEKLLNKAFWPENNGDLKLVNALSKDLDRMRPSLVPQLLQTAAVNTKNFERFSFFELGRSYSPNSINFSVESTQLGYALYDRKESRFMEAVDTVEELLASLNIPGYVDKKAGRCPLIPQEWKGVHPFEYLDIVVMGRSQGVILTVHPIVLREFKIKGQLTIVLLDISQVEGREMKDKTKYRPLPKFPGSSFDCTVVMDTDRNAAEALDALKKVKHKELQGVKIVGVYGLSDTQKTVTLRATYLDPDKTLSGEFLDKTKEEIISALEGAGFPLKK